MAYRFQQFLLATCIIVGLPSLYSAAAYAQTSSDAEDGSIKINPIKVVEPNVKPRKVYEAGIDTEFFEVGIFAGLISVEDFGSSSITGVKASFHATEDFFLQANYGETTVGRTSYERLSGDDANVLPDNDRSLSYYDLLVGYNLFPGESFITQNLTLNSAFYLVAGAGNTDFAQDRSFTLVVGSGYRVILNDWITWNLDYRDHMFETELLGEKKQTHNLELSSSVTFFF